MTYSGFRHLTMTIAILGSSACGQLLAQSTGPNALSAAGASQSIVATASENELSPEVRQLLARIREQEATVVLALNENKDEFQVLKREGRLQELENQQRKIIPLLNEIVGLKLQVEEIQVTELRSRLERFEQQIRQRKELRDKIVEHRFHQLVDKAVLEWNSPAAQSESQVQDSATLPAPPIADPSANYGRKNAGELERILGRAFPRSKIYLIPMSKKLLIRGQVPDEETRTRIAELTGLYFPNLAQSIINELQVAPHQSESNGQIQSRGLAVPIDPQIEQELASYQKSAKLLQAVLDQQFPDSAIKCIGLINGNILLKGEYTDQSLHSTILEISRLHAPEVIDNTRPVNSFTITEFMDMNEAPPKRKVKIVIAGPSILPGNPASAQRKLEQLLSSRFPKSTVKCEVMDGDLLLTGEVTDSETVSQILDVVRSFAPGVVNHLKIRASNAELADSTKSRTDDVKADDSIPTLEQMRKQLEPLAARFKEVLHRAKELESAYLHDRSTAANFRNVLTELATARRDFQTRYKEFEGLGNALGDDVKLVQAARTAAHSRLVSATRLANSGTVSRDEIETSLKSAIDEENRANKVATLAETKLNEFHTMVQSLLPDAEMFEGNPPPIPKAAINSPQPGFRIDVVRTSLEQDLSSSLELVPCAELGLWFKAALRVRETSGGLRAGDLIVLVNDHLFENWNQAFLACGSNGIRITCLHGFTGHPFPVAGFVSSQSTLSPPSSLPQALYKVEIQSHGDGVGESNIEYLSGTCVSPEGLLVIPLMSKQISRNPEITVSTDLANDDFRTRAHVVKSDDDHGLTLLKMDLTNLRRPGWLKCRTRLPAQKQQLSFSEKKSELIVAELQQPLTPPLVGNDAFVLTTDSPPHLRLGHPICAFNGELQGILIAVERNGPVAKLIGLPAVHIEKLLDDYLRVEGQ